LQACNYADRMVPNNIVMELTPDIVIENDPHKEYLGQDDQLNKAIGVALELLKTQGKKVPPVPPFPDKSGKK
jgi:tricorn protease